jgi:hypothetical protein
MFFKSALVTVLLHVALIATSQDTARYYTTTHGGLCTTGIVLFPDGLYNLETGCEASSSFCFGRWIQRKDTIIFTPVDRRTYVVIKNVSARQTGDTMLAVRITDVNGVNITQLVQPRQLVKGKGFYRLRPDSLNGTVNDLKRDSAVIRLVWLERLFKKEVSVPVISTANFYEITVNISGSWIFSERSLWYNMPEFKLLRTRNGLVSVWPDNVNEQGNMVRTVYLLEK